MDKTEKELKAQFVTDLCNAMRDSILKQIEEGKLPENWDGHELRMLIEYKAIENAARSRRYAGKKRVHEFNNTVIVENL